MSLALFGSSQSVTFDCKYLTLQWGTLGSIYFCYLQNVVNISSPDAATVDSITGTHLTGYNNDKVQAIQFDIGQINYFPRGLNKFFKNLRGLQISGTGLKEIHQSDLKDFPKLINLYLFNNNLQVIEENLFQFNPNLELIYLHTNKLTYINPYVFSSLIKLNVLHLNPNTCININANNPTEVQNVIKTAISQCINLEYSNLEQQVKYLEMQSKVLDSATLKTNLGVLVSAIQNSAFPNFFQEQIQRINATEIDKAQEDAENLTLSGMNGKIASISDTVTLINNNYQDLNRRFMKLISALENAYVSID